MPLQYLNAFKVKLLESNWGLSDIFMVTMKCTQGNLYFEICMELFCNLFVTAKVIMLPLHYLFEARMKLFISKILADWPKKWQDVTVT